MTGPFEIDVEAARPLFADWRCPMPVHGDPRPPVEVVATQKLTTAEQATGETEFLGQTVPVRDAVIVRCTDPDCHWGREVTGLPQGPNGSGVLRMTHAGLGYVDVPPPHAGDEP